MNTKQLLQDLKDSLKASDRMPVVFIGHGNPMNAIEDTVFSRSWAELGRTLPRPQAIVVVSAHWMTRGTTLVDISAAPRTIHDFSGFPDELFAQQYPAPGNPELAREVVALLSSHHAEEDDRWGLDHGAWAILKFMYPTADVPVFQLSIDLSKDLDWHLGIGETLSELRDHGVLVLGSGNVVHNLGALRFDGELHDFAVEFDSLFATHMTDRNFDAVADRAGLGSLMRMAHPTLEHYIPALTIAGASNAKDALTFMTDSFDMGSVSMRSFLFHNS